MRALTRVAELYCRRAEYQKALEYAAKALDYVMYDPDANYIYGVIAGGWATWSTPRRRSDGRRARMKYRVQRLLPAGRDLPDGGQPRARPGITCNARSTTTPTTSRRSRSSAPHTGGWQGPQKAPDMLSRILDIDPLNHLARFEQLPARTRCRDAGPTSSR